MIGLRRTCLIALALSLGWLVLFRGYADYLARTDPGRALTFNPDQPEALLWRAQRALLDHRTEAAETAAQRALYWQPLEGRAIRILGAVAESSGDRGQALALMKLAASTTPRDVTAQFWLAINALADNDTDGALQRLDRLLRFEPQLQNDAFPILGTIATNPVGAQVIASHLASNPPWRAEFMHLLLLQAGAAADISRLFRAIESHGGQVSETETAQFTSRLLAQQDWPRLRRWIRRTAGGDTALVHDGGFDGRGRGPFLGWSLEKVPGADVLIASYAEGARGLRLVFHNRRVPFQHVSQWLLLSPGSYHLSGRVRLIKLATALGLTWTLSCAGTGTVLGKSERLLGDSDWRAFDFAFAVPVADCGAQMLRLGLDARISAEQQIVGEAWFDDLAIAATPVGALAAP